MYVNWYLNDASRWLRQHLLSIHRHFLFSCPKNQESEQAKSDDEKEKVNEERRKEKKTLFDWSRQFMCTFAQGRRKKSELDVYIRGTRDGVRHWLGFHFCARAEFKADREWSPIQRWIVSNISIALALHMATEIRFVFDFVFVFAILSSPKEQQQQLKKTTKEPKGMKMRASVLCIA